MTEYVGFDVSKEETAFCVKDARAGQVATDPRALFGAGALSVPWPYRSYAE